MELEILLFNPFHDKRGRFASAKGRAGSAKKWVGEHKKEIAIGVGVTAAVVGIAGITAYTVHKRNDGALWEANVVADAWEGTVSLENKAGGFSDGQAGRYLESVAVAQTATSAVGVDPHDAQEVLGHDSWREYARSYLGQTRMQTLVEGIAEKEGFEVFGGGKLDYDDLDAGDIETLLQGYGELPHGFARFDTKKSFLSPNTTRRIMSDQVIQGLTKEEMPGYRRGIKTAIHELIHARKASAPFHETGWEMTDYNLRKLSFMEEGLTDWATGDALKFTFPDIQTDRYLTYKRQVNAVSFAAFHKSTATGRDALDIRKEWLTMKNPYDDIDRWIKLNIEFGEIEESVQLFNPYHDKIGRFTTAKGARMIVGFVRKKAGGKGARRSPGARGSVSTRRGIGKEAVQEVRRQQAFLKKNLSGFDGSADIVLGGRTVPGMAGHYNSATNTIVMSKRRAKNLGKKFDYGSHALIHEQVHTRKGVKRRGQSKRAREASTELIARRMSHKMYGKHSNRAYSAPTRYLGNYAMRRSGGDKRRAWRYVSDVHLGRQKPPSWIWLDKSLSFGRSWEDMIRDPGDYQLSEIQLQEIDDRVMIVYDFLDEEKWSEAMTLAKMIGDDALIEDVQETAAHDGYFFDETKGTISEDGGPA